MKHTIPKVNAAERAARKAARAKAATDTPLANNVPELRAAVLELQRAVGITPAASK